MPIVSLKINKPRKLKQLHRFARTMLKSATTSEALMADRLNSRNIPYLAQHVIAYYIVDFFIPSKLAVIELDGEHHQISQRQRGHDFRRDEFLRQLGLTVFRVRNVEALSWDFRKLTALPNRETSELKTFLLAVHAARSTRGNAGHYARGGPVTTYRIQDEEELEAQLGHLRAIRNGN